MLFISDGLESSYEATSVGVIVSVASFVSLIVILAVCLCCYRPPDDDDDDYEDYESLMEEDDIETFAKVPLMGRLPDQELNVARVQPMVLQHSSINRKLGVGTRLVSAGTIDEKGELSSDDEKDDHFVPGGVPPPSLLGRLQVHLQYDFDTMTLNLRLICAENLPPKDLFNTADPYVKIMLLPDRKHRFVSHMKRKNLNPQWEETFCFDGYPFPSLVDKILYMLVLDYDRITHDDEIGEVILPLRDVDIAVGTTVWQNLQPCRTHGGKLGLVLVSLSYNQMTNKIIVGIIKARGLAAKDLNGFSDPYVKVWLMCDGRRIHKQKTKCIPKTLDPDFNALLTFEISPELLPLSGFLIVVMDRDIVKPNELIGRVVIGPNSGPVESKHWDSMIRQPLQTIEHWHVLKENY